MLKGLTTLPMELIQIGKELYGRSTLHKVPLKDDVLLAPLFAPSRDIVLDLAKMLTPLEVEKFWEDAFNNKE